MDRDLLEAIELLKKTQWAQGTGIKDFLVRMEVRQLREAAGLPSRPKGC